MNSTLFTFMDVSTNQLQSIDLVVHKGDRIALFGPSGAGKSSLLFLFNRLADPDEGSVSFKGKPLHAYDISRLRKEVGLVMQQANLFPGTVYDNLKFGPELFGEWTDALGEELMEAIQLPRSYLTKPADQLSGGERQRVSLARTLANRPSVLLLDEPTSAQDSRTAKEIEKVLLRLMKEKDLTIVLVTHDLKQAERLCGRGVFIAGGKKVEEGKIPDLFTNPRTKTLAAFLSK